ncbi:MAG: T9SS type A sorting domain-containing protein [Flavobacterium sp.]|uniref:T9SS type A sorting domain-containing protein n=1 Tax=Flavobacterium sp. TaxID=239 RepID=UPI0032663BE6
MKKIYFFMGLLFANFTFAQIQTEDFEADTLPLGWTTNMVSGTFDWAFGSGTMPSGASFTSNAAIYDDDAAGEGALDNTVELLSPAINLTSYTDLNLSFEYAIQDYIGSGYFTAEVWDGTAWVEILNVSVDTSPTVFTLDVTAYANPAFQVKFTYGDDNDWGWGAGVDNFSITGTLGINSFNQSRITVSPNPTADFININTTDVLTNMRIVDISGKIVQNIQNGTSRVDISNLSAGTYFLQYDTEGNHYLNRIVRK